MTTDKHLVNLEVPTDTLEKWDEYVDESDEFRGRSGMIRFAVSKHIKGQENDNTGSLDVATVQTLEHIAETIDDVRNRLESIETRMNTLETAVRDDPELVELANTVFRLLPTEPPGSSAWQEEMRIRDADPNTPDPEPWTGTVEGLAEALDEPEHRVKDAIRRLKAETHLVLETEYGGEVRYYKED